MQSMSRSIYEAERNLCLDLGSVLKVCRSEHAKTKCFASTQAHNILPRTLEKHKVLDTTLDVRGIERRTAKSQLQVVMVYWG